MENSMRLLALIALLLAFSNIARVESKCVKRNFKYPSPSEKPVSSSKSPQADQPSPPPSSSSSSQKAASASVYESPDAEPDDSSLKSKFGDMLKQVVNQIDPNSPILNIPKATVNDPEIVKMCQATDYPDLCQSTVAHFVDGRHDVVSMLEMVIKACQGYTRLAMATAKKLSMSPFYTKIRSRFRDIDEYYVDALDNLQDAANAIKARDIATVNINLSAALDDYGAYEDDWGETSPMADFDAKLTHMASNCLAISTLVKFK